MPAEFRPDGRDRREGFRHVRRVARLDKGIPNASRIGYTGTPIDKTERVFGDYIDKYTMRQAIADAAAIPPPSAGTMRLAAAWTLPT